MGCCRGTNKKQHSLKTIWTRTERSERFDQLQNSWFSLVCEDLACICLLWLTAAGLYLQSKSYCWAGRYQDPDTCQTWNQSPWRKQTLNSLLKAKIQLIQSRLHWLLQRCNNPAENPVNLKSLLQTPGSPVTRRVWRWYLKMICMVRGI